VDTITAKQLEEDYRVNRVCDLLKKYSVGINAFYALLDEAGIPRKAPRMVSRAKKSIKLEG